MYDLGSSHLLVIVAGFHFPVWLSNIHTSYHVQRIFVSLYGQYDRITGCSTIDMSSWSQESREAGSRSWRGSTEGQSTPDTHREAVDHIDV